MLHRASIGDVTREHLLHFLLIGAAIFGLYRMIDEPEAPTDAGRIVISAGDIERLETLWANRWQRPPTAEELRSLIDEHVREEILYREALAIGLDRDDAAIRRLLRQKFEFVTQDLAVAREPDAAELAAWFEANRERYRTQPRVSFTQVFFDPDRRGAAGEHEVRLVLARLRDGTASPETLGDSRMLDSTYRAQVAQEIETLFGAEFFAALDRIEPGFWSGPIASGYGLHLVRLDARTPGVVPPLGTMADRVRNDWAYEQRQLANEAVYRQLLARYEVVVETAATEPGPAGGKARP